MKSRKNILMDGYLVLRTCHLLACFLGYTPFFVFYSFSILKNKTVNVPKIQFISIPGVPYILIFFPHSIFENLYFLIQNFRLLPISPLDILPNSLNIVGKMIMLPLSLSSLLYSSARPWYFLPPLHNLVSFPTDVLHRA